MIEDVSGLIEIELFELKRNKRKDKFLLFIKLFI